MGHENAKSLAKDDADHTDGQNHQANQSHNTKQGDMLATLQPGLVALATIDSISENGTVWITLLDTETALPTLSNQAYTQADIQKTVACMRMHNSDQVVIIGPLMLPSPPESIMLDQLIDNYQEPRKSEADIEVFDTPYDAPHSPFSDENVEDELVFEAGKNITFKCGESSISLSADGRVNIRGKFLNNSASQLNRISGGSVKIN